MDNILTVSKTLKEIEEYAKPKKSAPPKSKPFDLFDFLANVNLDELCKTFPNINNSTNSIASKPVEKPIEKPIQKSIEIVSEKPIKNQNNTPIKKRKIPIIAKQFDEEYSINQESKEELDNIFEEVFGDKKYKCPACTKKFSSDSCLKRHYERFPVCKDWSSLSKESNCKKLTKGIHLVIEDILDEILKSENNLECKYCKITFTNKGNHHKHYNSATACNRLAYKDFVKAISSL